MPELLIDRQMTTAGANMATTGTVCRFGTPRFPFVLDCEYPTPDYQGMPTLFTNTHGELQSDIGVPPPLIFPSTRLDDLVNGLP